MNREPKENALAILALAAMHMNHFAWDEFCVDILTYIDGGSINPGEDNLERATILMTDIEKDRNVKPV